ITKNITDGSKNCRALFFTTARDSVVRHPPPPSPSATDALTNARMAANTIARPLPNNTSNRSEPIAHVTHGKAGFTARGPQLLFGRDGKYITGAISANAKDG